MRDTEAAAARQTKESQQHQRLLDPRSHNNHHNHIAYRNFVHSIKSPRTRIEYVRSLRIYMSWLSVYDNYDTMLQKDPRLIASDIIDFIIYLRNEKKLAPATINMQIAALHHFYEMNDVDLKWNNKFI